MHIVDSCGWLEWFTDGNLAERYEQCLAEVDRILIPGVVLYEVYKILKRPAICPLDGRQFKHLTPD